MPIESNVTENNLPRLDERFHHQPQHSANKDHTKYDGRSQNQLLDSRDRHCRGLRAFFISTWLLIIAPCHASSGTHFYRTVISSASITLQPSSLQGLCFSVAAAQRGRLAVVILLPWLRPLVARRRLLASVAALGLHQAQAAHAKRRHKHDEYPSHHPHQAFLQRLQDQHQEHREYERQNNLCKLDQQLDSEEHRSDRNCNVCQVHTLSG
mmetsp:Transcript_44411/g.105209  ORF Transcript_44411/g.105209 Transcript_44411/m.105209 type:complete len:210 (-) Transcript_44411:252-881(-)